MILALDAIGLFVLGNGNGTQRPIIHVHAPGPDNTGRINVQRIALIDAVIKDSRNQIVRRRDCMHVTGEMEVDRFHRHNLRIPTARSSALETEDRSK